MLRSEYLIGTLGLLIFFLIETFTRNEYLLTVLIIFFSLLVILTNKNLKLKIYLWLIGAMLGFLIEVVMGFVTRSQYWNYGTLYGVPLWLPFVWGYCFISIYLLSQYIKSKIE